MEQQAHEVIAVGRQAIQHADANIVTTALHGAIHCLGVPAVVTLRAGWMQCFVIGLVISFLEQDIGADASLVQTVVAVHIGGGDVYVHAANGAVAHARVIDGLD